MADRLPATASRRTRNAGSGRLPRLPGIPTHVPVLFGLATAGYAVTLAGVSGLQASAEAEIAARRAPVAVMVDDASRGHDRLAAALVSAGQRYEAAAAGYDSTASRLAELERTLAGLASVTRAVDGASQDLPTRLAIPTVVRTVARTSSSTSTAHATTGGSAP